MADLVIWVPGVPQPQGSTRAFKTKNGKVVTTSANLNLKPWRHAVTWEAAAAIGVNPWGAPKRSLGSVALELDFIFPRPKSHFGQRGLLPSSPSDHTKKPDLDKLIRAVLDGLTDANVWLDDSQVDHIDATKFYVGERRDTEPGVRISITAHRYSPNYASQPAITPDIPAQEATPLATDDRNSTQPRRSHNPGAGLR